jgi:hypothetical protein
MAPDFASDLKKASVGPSPAELEQRAYLSKVKVSNLEIGKSVLDEDGVFGEVQNIGNRSLDEVEITIYFLDAGGRAVHEKTYHPILVSEYSFDADRNKPLRPGYSRKFGVRADDAPSTWTQRVRVGVTAVKFSPSQAP